MNLKTISLLFIISACVLTAYVALLDEREPKAGDETGTLGITDFLRGGDATGFERVDQPRPFIFPADHGAHENYRSEWWYFTGNLDSSSNRKFGYQLTFFRFSPTASIKGEESAWRSRHLFMAHFALTDIAEDRFYSFERFSRGAAGLAGAKTDGFRVWLDDWFARTESDTGFPLRLQAKQDGIMIDLKLEQGKNVVLHGDRGVSTKNAEPGNASYYYSYTRMPATGTISVGDRLFNVAGNSWMDREWSSSALGKDQLGWDWFALQLDNQHELMFYRLRRQNGEADPFSYAALILPDGDMIQLNYRQLELEVTSYWESKQSHTRYPSGWELRIPDREIELHIEPQVAEQELLHSFRYWEGAVKVSGTQAGEDISGRGYVELAGY